MPITAPPPAGKEETLWRGNPSWMLLLGRLIIILLASILVQVIARVAASSTIDFETSERTLRIGWILTLAVVVIGGIWFAVGLLRLSSTIYTVTNQRVMIETGLFTKSLGEIDLRYVDDTQFFQSLLHRIFGIGSVTIISSDKSSPTYVLRAVRDPRGLRELIRTHSYQVSQRQIFTRTT